jgi:hypothetical protein
VIFITYVSLPYADFPIKTFGFPTNPAISGQVSDGFRWTRNMDYLKTLKFKDCALPSKKSRLNSDI